MSPPSSKKVKLDPDSVSVSDNRRITRSNNNASKTPEILTNSTTKSPTKTTSKPKVKTTTTAYDSDNMGLDSEEDGGFFEYDSNIEEDPMIISESEEELETITLTDSGSDSEVQEPPPEVIKGKLSSRKKYLLDIESLVSQYGSNNGELIRNFEAGEDESVVFTLIHPKISEGLNLIIMTPEPSSGYPNSQSMCYAQNTIPNEMELIISEVAQLPAEADRSLNGTIQYLISRLIHGNPDPYIKSNSVKYPQNSQKEEEDDDEEYEGDFGLDDDISYEVSAQFKEALRSDFQAILKAGYRVGFTRLSELDNVVVVSKKVNTLGVSLRALQAWDSELITGSVRYLVLLMNFGSKYPVNMDSGTRGEVQFRVGISPHYKPSRNAIATAFKAHSVNKYTEGDFQAISLTVPLDSLFSDKFQEVLLARRSNNKLGWAGAEHHCLNFGQKDKVDKKACQAADKIEKELAASYALPSDPLMSDEKNERDNYPLMAYSYLVRRFIMCPRFCLICFKTIETDIVALKPFVCESQLCLFQLISLGLGPSLEHEIKTNAPAVDLLVQLAYIAAKDNRLTVAMQPEGLSLEVPEDINTIWKIGDKTVEFDTLGVRERNVGMANLINELPPISEMKYWLDANDLDGIDKDAARVRKLSGMKDGSISNSAWKVLRWIVASNTSYLRMIEEEDELVQGIPKIHRQFRLVVGSPIKEHLLSESIKAVQARNANAVKYPTIFAFHGSAVKNWHSILREGLNFNETINGRAYGHGVYFAINGEVSLGTYAQASSSNWKGADFAIGKLAAICEITNMPTEFVSSAPYYVVNNLDFIQCRYLVVVRGASTNWSAAEVASTDKTTVINSNFMTKNLVQDPTRLIALDGTRINIPDILPKLKALSQKLDDTAEDLNDSDTEVLKEPPPSPVATSTSNNSYSFTSKLKKTVSGFISSPKKKGKQVAVQDAFVPAKDEIVSLIKLLPPPAHPNKGASHNIQREMMALIKEQEKDGPKVCGFYFDPERSNDNIFTWIVELIFDDPELPLVKDMKSKGVTSLLMEIRFSENFPLAPPFIRLVYPRLLPFISGGGGHVTGGGSICMDLLTSNGWSPVYQISAVLLQIRMAISNLDPRPARLDSRWETPYTMQEAVQGFSRAAATHGWQVPAELRAMTTSI